ncbi:MAG TPA: hemerythrin domain-containing protein [Verrucomicrobiae bacterium]|jgi:hemerythrin-like domain-containing protein|nr:hemerythrin domain-containing protein [Verrucomicrobiae bacterium]
MNAVQFLKQEHEKAKAEFEKVLKASPTTRGGLWEHLVPELEVHEQIEEACLYEPIARDASGRDAMIAGWRDKHQSEVEKVKDLIEEIEDLEPESQEWLTKVNEVHTSLRTHIQEEEGTIFPRLPGVWDAARLERAGRELEEMKASKVSTRH